MSSNQPWHGKLIDVNGRIGTIQLELSDDEHQTGTWKATLSERDAELEIGGEAKTEGSKEGIVISLHAESKENGQLGLKLQMKNSEAGQYAQSALLGEYENSATEGNSPLSRGVIVFWQFK